LSNELDSWAEAASHMYDGLDQQTGLHEQFAGFLQLEPVDLARYEPRNAPMDVLLGRERTERSQVIKQADVVMLMALLWERFTPEVRETNYRYYEPLCGHGSSLSPAVHSLVAARLGDVAVATQYLRETWSIDLGDAMGNTAGGVHMGALGGLWQAVVLGFGGMSLSGDGLRFDPHLPVNWDSLSFAVRHRGRTVRATVRREPSEFTARLEDGGLPIPITVGGVTRVLQPGGAQEWRARVAKSARSEGSG
jgi:kojibiose phosphorylase